MEIIGTMHQLFGLKSNYTSSTCLLNAAIKYGHPSCPKSNVTDWWYIYGSELGCFNKYTEVIGEITNTTAWMVDGAKEVIQCEVISL